MKAIESGDTSLTNKTRRWSRIEIDPLGFIDNFTTYSIRELSEN